MDQRRRLKAPTNAKDDLPAAHSSLKPVPPPRRNSIPIPEVSADDPRPSTSGPCTPSGSPPPQEPMDTTLAPIRPESPRTSHPSPCRRSLRTTRLRIRPCWTTRPLRTRTRLRRSSTPPTSCSSRRRRKKLHSRPSPPAALPTTPRPLSPK